MRWKMRGQRRRRKGRKMRWKMRGTVRKLS
jgi:hypothetical protein